MTAALIEAGVVETNLELVSPLVTSAGTHRTRTAGLVRVLLSDGSVGWGENVAPEGSFYTGEDAATSIAHLRAELIPASLGRTFATARDFELSLGRDAFPMARHALSSAVWDAMCRREGIPLAVALGGEVRDIEVVAVVGIGASIVDTVAECAARVGEGYRHLKVKIAPGKDIDVVASVRAEIGDDVTLSVDANGSFDATDLARLARLADAGVRLVEQPFATGDLASHVRLVAETDMLVGLDESVMHLHDLVRALDAGACTALNVKASRAGGFAAAVELLDTCRERGIDTWIGGMLESGIGRAGALALASHPACTLAPDLSASNRYFVRDVCEPFVLDGGCLRVPDGAGIGVVVDEDVLTR